MSKYDNTAIEKQSSDACSQVFNDSHVTENSLPAAHVWQLRSASNLFVKCSLQMTVQHHVQPQTDRAVQDWRTYSGKLYTMSVFTHLLNKDVKMFKTNLHL